MKWARRFGYSVVLFLTACTGGGEQREDRPSIPTTVVDGAAPRMLAFQSEADLKDVLIDGLRNISQQPPVMMLEMSEVAQSDVAAVRPQDSSDTNVQVQGVDEGDRIKSDGRWLYALSEQSPASDSPMIAESSIWPGQRPAQSLVVTRLADAERPPEVVERVSLPDNVRWQALYHYAPNAAERQLVIEGSEQRGYGLWWDDWAWHDKEVSYELFPIQADGKLARTRQSVVFDGGLVASRRVDDHLYIALRHTPSVDHWIPHPMNEAEKQANEARLSDTSLADLLPHWRLNGVDQGALVGHQDCYPSSGDSSRQRATLMTLVAYSLSQSKVTSSQCVVGQVDTLFMSPGAVYVASNENQRFWAWDAAMSYAPEHQTQIHKFSTDNAQLTYRGSAKVQGHLGWHADKMPFRMGEHKGVLTVVTSQTDRDKPVHRLYNLGPTETETFARLAVLPNSVRSEAIGKPGEHLYGVRMVGNRAYLVTFKQTDPLYAVDLSDAKDPKVLGELEITGFSDYLHPLSEVLLLGVGKEAVESGEHFALAQGVKISLFDVSDPTNPIEVDKRVIGQRGSEAGVSQDHRAMAVLPATGERPLRLALPIRVHQGEFTGTQLDPREFQAFSHRGLYLYELPTLQAAGARLQDAGMLRVDKQGRYMPDRALLAGEYAYLQGAEQLYYAPWANPEAVTPVD